MNYLIIGEEYYKLYNSLVDISRWKKNEITPHVMKTADLWVKTI